MNLQGFSVLPAKVGSPTPSKIQFAAVYIHAHTAVSDLREK